MSDEEKVISCLNCEARETEVPLISLRYAGRSAWICSRCMPTLVHHPHELAEKLRRDAESPAVRQI